MENSPVQWCIGVKDLIEYITDPGNVGAFLLAISMLAAAVVLIEKFVGWCSGKFRKYYDARRGREIEKETTAKQEEHLDELDNKLDNISTKMDEIVNHLDTFVANQKKVNTVLLRDKIYYIYKDALKKGYILEKDKKNFKYAFDEYVRNDGNSYVIDEVEPFIHNLKVYVDEEHAQMDLKGDQQ